MTVTLEGGHIPPLGPGSGIGSAGEVAFLDSDLNLAFDSGFSYDSAAKRLTIQGHLTLDNATSPSLTLTEDGGTNKLVLINASAAQSTIQHIADTGQNV